MFKVRYEVATGKVNLITNSTKEIPVDGHKYMEVDKYPEYDDTSQHLYVRNDVLVAVDIEALNTDNITFPY